MPTAIGKMNARVTVNVYANSQDDRGGNVKTLSSSYDTWAAVRSLKGDRRLDNMQVIYSQVFEIIMRYENEITIQNTIVNEGKTLVISSVTIEEESKKKFYKITAWQA